MLADFVKESTSTQGAGTITLAAIVGFARVADAFANGTKLFYSIRNGNNWESGIGTAGAGNTLTRSTILTTLSNGVYNKVNPVALALSGSSEVYATPLRGALPYINDAGKLVSPNTANAPTAFTAATFENSWVDYAAGYNAAGYYKDATGIVHLRGLVTGGTISTTSNFFAIFTLPSGLRPAARELHSTLGNDVAARVDILTDGRVLAIGGATGWRALDGLTFTAA